MNRHRVKIAGVLLLVASLPARAETMEEVEKKLMEAHAKLDSFVARIKHDEHVNLTGTDFMASKVTGTAEWMRKGDKILYRMEIAGKATQNFGGNEQTAEQTSILVSDGTLYYTYAEQLGQKRFIKQKVDNSINGDIRSVLDIVRADNNFKLGADDKVDGADCYVVEVTPKIPPSDDNPIHITLIYFRKDNGLNTRVVSKNKDGKTVYDHSLVDLKTGVKIDASQFVLHKPDGVELTDLTEADEPHRPVPAEPPPAKP